MRPVILPSRHPNITAARLLFVFTLGLVWYAVFVEGVMRPLGVGELSEVEFTRRDFPPYYEWQGPSRSFRERDIDGTGTISLQEWEKISFNRKKWEDGTSDEEDFRMGDCNGDQVLTWHEYHQLRFWGRWCPSY